MKKYLPYFLFSAIAAILSIVLSYIFEFSLSNTWQARISLLFVLGPLCICGWKETTAQKHKHPIICFIIRFYLVCTLFVLGVLIVTIVFPFPNF